ncbi:MAG: hypothetical protein K6G16_00020 [Lachnospiraceae bacterium]|nr:hypothetical protein [Lachnospiraceae bacterium]
MRLTLEDPSETPAENKENVVPSDADLKKSRKERIAAMTPREKWLYFLDYYKIPVIAIAAVLIFAVLITRDIRNNLPVGFQAEFLNAIVWDSEEFAASFAEAAGIDLTAETCTIDNDVLQSSDADSYDQASLYSAEKLMVRIAAAEIDVLAADEDIFVQYARGGTLADLREILSDEDLAFYAPYLVEAAAESESGVMSAPCPMGIRAEAATRLNETGAYPEKNAVIGIVANTKHPDRAVAFLNYLFDRP